MATSSIFYRFRSQKDPSRITFDGPSHTIFELKRDIILLNKLGEGTDFELRLYDEEGEEYEDDTTHVSRSSTVIARRSPARMHGKGGAARYVSGRMPVNARKATGKPGTGMEGLVMNGVGALAGGDEADNLAAMLGAQRANIAARQDELESSAPIRRPLNKAEVPDKPPPPGYVCYRCGEKGHWIQACPTNNDPDYVSQPRFKRTTGIPKSMLVKVNRADIENEAERPAGLMLSAEGEWVMAKSDYEEFQKYQAKVRQSKVAQLEEKQGNKDLQDRGLECPLDKRMFVDPVKTPCCGKTYCSACINNALTDNDLHCPDCKSEILFDDLSPDDEKRTAVRAYETERVDRAKEQASRVREQAAAGSESKMDGKPEDAEGSGAASNDQTNAVDAERDDSGSPESKKRKAGTLLKSNRAGNGPPLAPSGAQSQAQAQQSTSPMAQGFMSNGQNAMWPMPGMPGMSGMGQWPMNMPMIPGMEGMPNMQWPQQGDQQDDSGNGGMGGNWQGRQYQGQGQGQGLGQPGHGVGRGRRGRR